MLNKYAIPTSGDLGIRNALQASKDPTFRFEEQKPNMMQDDVTILQRMHAVRGSNSLQDQADAVLGHITDPAEKLKQAGSLLQGWKRATGEEFVVPPWLAAICAE